MFGFTKVRNSALVAAAGLTAALALASPAAPAAAASHQPAIPRACHPISGLDRDEHTGRMWAYGYTSCPVRGPAAMRVNIWVDSKAVRGRSQSCRYGSNCYTSSGMITPRHGRHRYCSQVWFYWASTDPTQASWYCRYIG